MITIDFDRLNLPDQARILDVGCGSGRHVGAAYQQDGAVAIGIDPNLNDLSAAVERLHIHDRMQAHGGGAWHLAAADALRLPFAAQSFDLVICSEVLEHIVNDHQAMVELVRVTKPGGIIAVSVPRFWPERICWRLSKTYAAASGGHVRIYHTRQLISRLKQAGFPDPNHRHWAHALHVPFWWLKCIAGSQSETCGPIRAYHRLLVWDMMRKPRLTRWLERLLNPVMGKSVVLYFMKSA